MASACCAVSCLPLIVATTRFGSCCATASGPLTFSWVVEAAGDAWLLEGEELLFAGFLAGEDVPCADTSMPQEKMAITNTLLFIQDVYSIPPTLTREDAVLAPGERPIAVRTLSSNWKPLSP